MKNTPAGWPRISPALYYEDAKPAIEWLCRAFGFELRLLVEGENGRVEHAELTFGDGLIMVGSATTAANPREGWRQNCASPRSQDGYNTQSLAVFVDDVDAHCAHARTAGAAVFQDPHTEDYGEDYWSDRSYGAVDLEGHQWWFMQRVREQKSAV